MYIFNNYREWVTIFKDNEWIWNIYSHTYMEKSWIKWYNLKDLILIFKKNEYERDKNVMIKYSAMWLNNI